jgi:hypothetical protein
MNTIKLLTLLVLSTSIVVSCATSKKVQQVNSNYPNYGGYQPSHNQQVNKGVYQDGQNHGQYTQQYQSQQGPDAAGFEEIKRSPIETLSLQTGTNEIRAFGSAESGNEQMALNAARAQATAALQEKIEIYVRSGLDSYTQEVGVNSEYSLDEQTRNQVITAAKGIVNGATVLDTRKLYNPNTKRYKYEVCVKYDKAGVLGAMQQQSERIRSNEKKFEQDMQKAWDELDAQKSSAMQVPQSQSTVPNSK